MFPDSGFDMFSVMYALFPIVFILAIAVILVSVFRGLRQWNYNNHQPVLTVDAKVVGKRTHTSHNSHGAHNNHAHTTSTTCYATFEFESGDRLELHLSGREYGLLAEGDTGKLTFQGTRYHGFARHIPQ